jgi:hypothetical protein
MINPKKPPIATQPRNTPEAPDIPLRKLFRPDMALKP